MKKVLKFGGLILIIAAIGVWTLARSGKLELGPARGVATLSWEKGDDKSVTEYRIYYGASPRSGDCPPGGYEKNQSAGKNSEYVLADLEPGRVYYFSVSALNGAGKESCFSEEMKKEIASAPELYWEMFWKNIKKR